MAKRTVDISSSAEGCSIPVSAKERLISRVSSASAPGDEASSTGLICSKLTLSALATPASHGREPFSGSVQADGSGTHCSRCRLS